MFSGVIASFGSVDDKTGGVGGINLTEPALILTSLDGGRDLEGLWPVFPPRLEARDDDRGPGSF